jgi:hypothetical protein
MLSTAQDTLLNLTIFDELIKAVVSVQMKKDQVARQMADQEDEQPVLNSRESRN